MKSMNTLRVPAVEVMRSGRSSPLYPARPLLSSRTVHWDGLALETFRVAPSVIPDHEHPTHVLHLITEGPARSTAIVDGRQFSELLAPGHVMLVPRGTRDRNVFHEPVTITSLALHPQLLARSVADTCRDVELVFHWGLSDRHLLAVLLALQADVEDGSPTGRLYGEALGTALAVYLARRYAVHPVPRRVLRGGLPTYQLRRVLDYISAHLDRDTSLADLARVAGLSPHHFSELFRQRVGMPPHRYVLERRIERAKDLLRNRTLTILEVALLTGFKDQGHFGRVFRQVIGMPPSRYRTGL